MSEAERERWAVRLAFAALVISLFALGVTYLQWRSAERAADIANQARIDANASSAAALAEAERARVDAVNLAERQRTDAQMTLSAQRKDAAAALNANISASQQSNTLATEALDAQTRPWLGIEGNLVPISSGRTEHGRDATFSFRLRDYGQSPAMKVAFTFSFNNLFSTNETRLTSVCKEARERSTASRPEMATTLPSIFPGDSGVTPPITETVEANDIFPQFLVGCIAYQGHNGIVHTTRLVYAPRQDKIKGQIFEYIPRGTTSD